MSELRIPVISTAAVPSYAHPSDAGADLSAAEAVTLSPGARALVTTGLRAAIPVGYVGLVHPRSGLAVKHGLTVLNAPGTIDANYRGDIKVLLWNTDAERSFTVNVGERIAQLVIQKVEHAVFVETETLDGTDRGASGFGSTGV